MRVATSLLPLTPVNTSQGAPSVGLFSKPNSKVAQADISSKVNQIILNWQGWVDAFLEAELEGKSYSLSHLNDAIAFLVTEAAARNDELLLQWTSKACAAIKSSTKDIAPVDSMAQVMFDVSAYSITIRKKYSGKSQFEESITLLGLAALKTLERHPDYKDVLEYMRLNSKKLAGN
jgi:hypothetical protein